MAKYHTVITEINLMEQWIEAESEEEEAKRIAEEYIGEAKCISTTIVHTSVAKGIDK